MKYSVIIPVFNEKDSIRPLFDSLKGVMDSLWEEYEVIFINDGSKDATLDRLKELAAVNTELKIINFNEHKGQGKSFEEAFRRALGEIIFTMDGDLQHDPQDIPKLIGKMDEGFDLICTWRDARKDGLVKRLKAKTGNFLQRMITGLNVHDICCAFRAYRREMIKDITFKRKFDFSLLPYIIFRRHKAKIAEVNIKHDYRKSGKTKYRTPETILGTIYSYLKLILELKQ